MDRIPDTPPDGDFARYVEQLNARSAAAALARQAIAASSHGQFPAAPAVPGKDAGNGAAKAVASGPPAGLSLWAVGKWMLIAWIALQLISVLVPKAGMLSLPLLFAFAAWLVYRFKKATGGLLTGQLRQLAEQAAKEFKQRK